jgi:hypothetical protein
VTLSADLAALGEFLKRVALIPLTPEEIMAAGQQELERSVTFEALEQQRNRGLPFGPVRGRVGRSGWRAQRSHLFRQRRPTGKGFHPHAFGDRVRYPLALNNWYSIEHHTSTPIAEWGFKTLRVNTEEDSILTDRGIEFLVSRQTEWLLIPTGV